MKDRFEKIQSDVCRYYQQLSQMNHFYSDYDTDAKEEVKNTLALFEKFTNIKKEIDGYQQEKRVKGDIEFPFENVNLCLERAKTILDEIKALGKLSKKVSSIRCKLRNQ